jgi:hypothetical protein
MKAFGGNFFILFFIQPQANISRIFKQILSLIVGKVSFYPAAYSPFGYRLLVNALFTVVALLFCSVSPSVLRKMVRG